MKKILTILLAMTLLFTLVACGGQAENEDPENGSTQQDTAGAGNEGYVFDIQEDDHTVVFSIANIMQVYTHDGKVVTGYATYADYGDADTAKIVASTINPNDSYYVTLGLKSVKAQGKYVVMEYSEKGFPCKTYEELHDLAQAYKQVQQ